MPPAGSASMKCSKKPWILLPDVHLGLGVEVGGFAVVRHDGVETSPLQEGSQVVADHGFGRR